MKTNHYIISKITLAFFMIFLALNSLVTVSSQSTAQQSFCYKTDFIKQMVYKISSDFFTKTGTFYASCQNKNYDAVKLPVKYTRIARHTSSDSNVDLNGLADFLTRAAKLNTPVAEMETEQDNSTLDFLTAAAQLYSPVAHENNSSDDTLDFLKNAAQLNTPVATEEIKQDDNMLDFLTRAAHLNDCIAE